MRQAREQELKCLRDLGVFEKVDEREARVQYQVTPVDTKLIDTSKAFEEKPLQIRSRTVAREFKSGDRPDLYAGISPLEAFKAIITIALHHNHTCSPMHIDVPLVLVRIPVEDKRAPTLEHWIIEEKSMYGTRDAARNWERAWQKQIKSLGFQLRAQLEESVSS